MEVVRDSRGLGVNWVGQRQWDAAQMGLLASVAAVFLLSLTCLVFSY